MLTKKSFLFWLKYSLCLITVIALVDYYFYLSYKKKIISRIPDNRTLSELEIRVGVFASDKRSSYINFEKKKSNGITRIGCFGDSMAYGSEVSNIYDYPSLLQHIFSTDGYEDIEVINFGTAGLGFHQAFMLWEYFAKEYNLDYVLLGPTCFQRERDSTFNVTGIWSGGRNYCPYSFHSRYILKNNDVELINTVGRTPRERLYNYLRFIPHWRYLRFDVMPPPFLSAPIICLFCNKNLKKNPFYYKNDLDKEMNDIYKILLSKIANDTSWVMWGHYGDKWAKEISINSKNFFPTVFYYPTCFPYMAFRMHNSPLGNKILAQQYFDCLTDKTESTLTLIETKDIENESKEKIEVIAKQRLSDYKDIAIEINSIKIGRFYDTTFSYEDSCSPPFCEPIKNSFSEVVSLLCLRDENIIHAPFLGLDFKIEQGLPLIIRIKDSLGVRDYPIDNVKLLNPGLNIGLANIGGTFDQIANIIELDKHSLLGKGIYPLNRGATLSILLKNVPILSGTVGEKIKLSSSNGRFLIIRADGREILDVEELSPTGIIYLSLYTKEGQVIKVPFANWVKAIKKISLGKPRKYFLERSNQHK